MKRKFLFIGWIVFFLLLGVSACGGGGSVDYEGSNPVVGPFCPTLLIPDRNGGGQALVQGGSLPLLGVFQFYLEEMIPPPMRFDFYGMEGVLLGIPDSLVLVESQGIALITTSGDAEGVWAFRADESFQLIDTFLYTGESFPLPHPAPDSQGVVVSSVEPVLTSGAALVGEKIYVATSNMRAGVDPVCQPGTVWIAGFGGAVSGFHSSVPEGVILTSRFNPTDVTPFDFVADGRTWRTLLVTNTGVLAIAEGHGVALTDGSVDVVDVEKKCVVASYPLGRGAPGFSQIAVAEQPIAGGGIVYRGYLGSAGFNHVYELDLTGLEAYMGTCPDPGDIPLMADKVLAGPGDPIRATDENASTPNDVVQVVVNHDSTRAYATGYNTGTLAVLELSTESSTIAKAGGGTKAVPVPSPKTPLSVIRITEPMPSMNEVGPGPVAVRPGVPGVDFLGPDIFVLTGYPVGELRSVQTY